ncbi:hypothetical protein CLOM_g8154, partial [Closterium sp. NIES-68]
LFCISQSLEPVLARPGIWIFSSERSIKIGRHADDAKKFHLQQSHGGIPCVPYAYGEEVGTREGVCIV